MKKRKITYIISAIVCAVIVAGVSFCIGYKTSARFENASPSLRTQTFCATIYDISENDISVKGMEEINGVSFSGDFILEIASETKIIWRHIDITLEDLKAGDRVAVSFSGTAVGNAPERMTSVKQIELLEDWDQPLCLISRIRLNRLEKERK